MSKIPVFSILLFLMIFFNTSCIKQNNLLENEQIAIEEYIEKTGLSFVEDQESGIYYYIKNSGIGNKLNDGDVISIAYSGTTLEDTTYIFSSSENYSFKIGDKDIIEGWNIAAKLFTVGTRAIVIIPFKLAYGNRPIGNIPENSTLIYELRILSDSPEIESNTDFFEYIDNLDSITGFTTNSVCYISIFEGIGDTVTGNSMQNIDYIAYNIDSTLTHSELSVPVTVGNNSINQGVDAGITFFNQGGMGRLVIPQELGFGSIGNSIFGPFSNLVYEIRVISNDLQVMEHSDLHKYIYQNKIKNSPMESGLYFINIPPATGDSIFVGDTVILNYSATLLSSGIEFDSCDSCQFILDSPDLPEGVNEGIKLMKKGGEAKLILPSAIGFGSEQHGDVPPFSNLIYEIEVIE
jgi:FKBP-type peptidyl-prolyl cis-trans isomerase FkpA